VARRLDTAKHAKTVRVRLNDFLIETGLMRQARHWAMTLRDRKRISGLDAAHAAVTRRLAARDQMRSSRLRAAAAAAHPS
jgi:hypothetical protein